ncbi:MAG: 50S ribosomal protein L4 [Candidatus Acidiferrales bacterium]
MPVVDVKNLQGKTVGQFELSDAVFGARINQNLLHETVRWYLAWQRAGTHKVKGRGEVSGSGKKLWRQKGTGRARVGSIRSSIWRKGGTVHGPVPRSYAYRLPKKIRLGALRSALSAKLAAEKLTIVDDWALETHKTKAFREVLDRLDGETKTILLVNLESNSNLERASRNLEGVKLISPKGLEVYDLLRHDRLMLSKQAAERLGQSLGGGRPADADEVVQIDLAPQAAPAKASEHAATEKPKKAHAAKAASVHKSAHKAAAGKAHAKSAKAPSKPRGKGKKD